MAKKHKVVGKRMSTEDSFQKLNYTRSQWKPYQFEVLVLTRTIYVQVTAMNDVDVAAQLQPAALFVLF